MLLAPKHLCVSGLRSGLDATRLLGKLSWGKTVPRDAARLVRMAVEFKKFLFEAFTGLKSVKRPK